MSGRQRKSWFDSLRTKISEEYERQQSEFYPEFPTIIHLGKVVDIVVILIVLGGIAYILCRFVT